jgi:hypothetical protein
MDGNGNAYLAGIVHAVAGFEYFTTTGCHQQTYGGSSTDFFLIKYNATGVRLWGTFYGGSSDEIPNQGQKLALDGSGNIYMIGSTFSTNNIATSGSINGNADGFVAKFNPNGVRQWAKYIGTSAADSIEGVAADASGNVYITGYTMSSSGLATPNAYQTSNNGIHNSMFAIKLNGSGTAQWGTYIGGNIDDAGYGIAVDANSSVYICGSTVSSSGLATTGSHQSSYGGNTDAFFAKLTECSATISGTATQTSACTGQTNGTLTVTPSGGAAPYEYKLGTGSFQTSNIFSGLASGAYSITIQDAAGCTGTFNTSVNQVPGVTTPVMTGSTAADEFTSKQYSTNQQSGAIYQWTVTQGTITAGQGTDAITVTWGPKTASGAVKVVVSQGAPCMDSTTITVNLTPSGISNITMETDVQVYPNPATDKLTIRMQADPKGEEIKLFDNYGKLVMRAPANKEQTIDISALPAGVYHINIGAWSRNISKL